MSPQTEPLHIPPMLALQPRQTHPLATEEHMVIRDRDRVLARIEALRPDLLPG